MNIKQPDSRLARRTLLRGAGVALALPWLESMSSLARAADTAGGIDESERPKRAVFTMWGLGVNGRDYTPTTFGREWEATTILKPVSHLRDEFTLISGLKLTHSGGHGGDRTFLTGTATHKADAKLRISADQELAEAIGKATRFPSLVLGVHRGTGFGSGTIDKTLAWTRGGTPIPAENRPHILFDKLFRAESAAEIAARRAGSGRTGSVLDAVRDEAKRLQNRLGKEDQAKLDEYFNSIRDVEQNIATDLAWLDKPKPEVAAIDFGQNVQALDPELQAKGNFDYRRYQRLMFDVIALALQTDSTRVINYYARRDLNDGTHCYAYKGCPYGYHEMTHHGEEADKLKWLTTVDTWYMEDWAYFIEKLRSVKEGDGTLLDNTLLVWGSSGGTENAHNNTNLPTMLVGGQKLGIKHQGHLQKKDVLLGNLWQTMFGVMGVAVPKDFQGGEADGAIKELV
ncbi:MAG: DUF1552 domain-containing protein [Planctomycetaceae bacterium]|nr:MAG: DUF1552 domain-containing protein [Planctomycetaceae bacterium]